MVFSLPGEVSPPFGGSKQVFWKFLLRTSLFLPLLSCAPFQPRLSTGHAPTLLGRCLKWHDAASFSLSPCTPLFLAWVSIPSRSGHPFLLKRQCCHCHGNTIKFLSLSFFLLGTAFFLRGFKSRPPKRIPLTVYVHLPTSLLVFSAPANPRSGREPSVRAVGGGP